MVPFFIWYGWRRRLGLPAKRAGGRRMRRVGWLM